MSNYKDVAINPKTGNPEIATYMDDYFGKYVYGVKFSNDETVYRVEDVERVGAVSLFLQLKEANEKINNLIKLMDNNG